MQDRSPRIGESNTVSFTVEQKHAITFAGDGEEISVLSTPSLIWFLEQAALQFLKPWLDEQSLSVGTQIDVEHLAPTLPGVTVNCTARLIYQDGSLYRFSVEAFADSEKIARGLHSRRIIRTSQLLKRLRKH